MFPFIVAVSSVSSASHCRRLVLNKWSTGLMHGTLTYDSPESASVKILPSGHKMATSLVRTQGTDYGLLLFEKPFNHLLT